MTGRPLRALLLPLLFGPLTLPLPSLDAAVCPAGAYDGGSGCVDCAVGTFSTAVGTVSDTCASCAPGTYAAAQGASACTYCESGKFNAVSASSACSDCLVPPAVPWTKSFYDIVYQYEFIPYGFGLGLTACHTCALNVTYNLNVTYIGDTGNKVVRRMELASGISPQPPNGYNYITYGNTYTPYILFTPKGSYMFYIHYGMCIYYLAYRTGTLVLVAGSWDSTGYVDASDGLDARFTSMTNAAIGSDECILYLLDSFRIRTYQQGLDRSCRQRTGRDKVSTLIGSGGSPGCQGGDFATAKFSEPYGIYASPSGKFLLVSDKGNHVIYLVNLVTQMVYIIAGHCNTPWYKDGNGLDAYFDMPHDIKMVPDESFAVVADSKNCVIRKIVFPNITAMLENPQIPVLVTTIIGSFNRYGDVDGVGPEVSIGWVYNMALSPQGGILYFTNYNKIKMADLSVSPVTVRTISGTDAGGFGYDAETSYRAPKTVSVYGCFVSCPANYYVIAGTTVCTACPANSYANAKAITCTANSGYYINGSSTSLVAVSRCIDPYICKAGTYTVKPCTQNSSADCASCNPGFTYSATDNAQVCMPCSGTHPGSCPLGSLYKYACTVTKDIGCEKCAPGTYSNWQYDTACTACYGGTYAPVAGSTVCTICPLGTYAGRGASACTSCAAGSYCPLGVSAPIVCAPGTLSSSTALSVCTPCQAGTYSTLTGATATSVCVACLAGYYSNQGASSCTICTAGTYTTSAGSGACTSCLAGKFSSTLGATLSSVCITCQFASYSHAGSSSCTPCPAWYNTTMAAAASLSDCSICQVGASYFTGACAPCSAGQYASSQGLSVCSSCSSNAFSVTAASSCQVCAAGSYLFSYTVAAPAGVPFAATVSSSGVPVSVGIGQYCSDYRAYKLYDVSGGDVPINPCLGIPGYCAWAPSSFCYQYGPSDVNNGKWFCSAGCYTASPCVGVANSVFTSAGSNGNPYSCQFQCNPGYKLLNGVCVFVGNCDLCANGTYSSTAGSTTCTVCPNGQFALSPGSTACQTCASCLAGEYPAGCGTAYGVCTKCPGGYFSIAGDFVCTGCPLGMYSTVVGATSSAVCALCSAGSYSTSPSSDCTLCPTGYTTQGTGTVSPSECNTCQLGAYSTAGACALCGQGAYSSMLDSTQCSNCTAGWFSGAGASACQACPAGKYLYSTSIAAPSTPPAPAATVSYLQSGSPVPLGAGQYCSDYYGGQRLSLSSQSSFDPWDETIVCSTFVSPTAVQTGYCIWAWKKGCNDVGAVPDPRYPDDPSKLYYLWDCVAGCKTASPCTNAVPNSYYTGPGANGNPLSCPIACIPGYMLINGACVLVGNCANCTAGTYSSSGATSCDVCSAGKYTTAAQSTACDDCLSCANGFYLDRCGTTPGVCVTCNNTA